MNDLPTYADVVAAADRIEGHAHRTPVITSRTADAELGAQIYFKCENLQRMGAFKFRGAFNALSKFDARQRHAGAATAARSCCTTATPKIARQSAANWPKSAA